MGRPHARIHTTGVKLIHHPVVGDLELPFESFLLAADPSQCLLTYTAEPGSPSQDALNLLASWAASTSAGPARSVGLEHRIDITSHARSIVSQSYGGVANNEYVCDDAPADQALPERGESLCVPKTLSTSCDQAVLIDQTGGVSLPSDAVLVEIDQFG
jgi:hypothetical protein